MSWLSDIPGNGTENDPKHWYTADKKIYNKFGTFQFPPPPRDVEQLIDFWRNVQIPESILESRFTTLNRVLILNRHGIVKRHQNESVKYTLARVSPERVNEQKLRHEKELKEYESLRPLKVVDEDLRSILCAHGIVKQSVFLSEKASEAARRVQFLLLETGRLHEAHEIVARYPTKSG